MCSFSLGVPDFYVRVGQPRPVHEEKYDSVAVLSSFEFPPLYWD